MGDVSKPRAKKIRGIMPSTIQSLIDSEELFYRHYDTMIGQECNNLTRNEWEAIKNGAVVHKISKTGKNMSYSINDAKNKEEPKLTSVNLVYSRVYCLDIDDLDVPIETILSTIEECFGVLPTYTLSRNKRLPHFYFTIDGDVPKTTSYKDVFTKLKGDLIGPHIVNNDGDTWCVNMVENYKEPMIGGHRLECLSWDNIKHLFNFKKEKKEKKEKETPAGKSDAQVTQVAGNQTLFTEDDNTLINDKFREWNFTVLEPYGNDFEDRGQVTRRYNATEPYNCFICNKKHRKNSNHPFVSKQGDKIHFVCRPNTKRQLIGISTNPIVYDDESVDTTRVYDNPIFIKHKDMFESGYGLTTDGNWFTIKQLSPTNLVYKELSQVAMDNLMKPYTVPVMDEKGKMKNKQFLDLYTRWEQRILTDKVIFYPDINFKEDGTINLFRGFRSEEVDIDPSYDLFPNFMKLFDKYLDCLTNYDKHSRQTLEFFIAKMIQDPTDITPVVPIFCSPIQGTGKSTLPKVIASILGDMREYLITSSGMDVFTAEFLPDKAHKAMIFSLEEIGNLKPKEMEKFKKITQDDMFEINLKFISKFSIPRFFKIIGSSNEGHKIKIVDGDRRLWLMCMAPDLAGNKMRSYWEEFYSKTGGLGDKQITARLFHHFKNMTLVYPDDEVHGELRGQKYNSRYIPQNTYSKTMASYNNSSLLQFLIDEWKTLKSYINKPSSLEKKTSKFHIEIPKLAEMYNEYLTNKRRPYLDEDTIRKNIDTDWISTHKFCDIHKSSVQAYRFTKEQQIMIEDYIRKNSTTEVDFDSSKTDTNVECFVDTSTDHTLDFPEDSPIDDETIESAPIATTNAKRFKPLNLKELKEI